MPVTSLRCWGWGNRTGQDICGHIGTHWESSKEKFACQWQSWSHRTAPYMGRWWATWTNNLPFPRVGLYRQQSIIYSVCLCKLTLDTTRPCFCSSPPLPRKKKRKKNNERNESLPQEWREGQRKGEEKTSGSIEQKSKKDMVWTVKWACLSNQPADWSWSCRLQQQSS